MSVIISVNWSGRDGVFVDGLKSVSRYKRDADFNLV